MRVTEQTLPQRQRINRQRHAIDESVPAVCPATFHRLQITLDQALVPQRPQLFQLSLSYEPAGGSKISQHFLVCQSLIQRDELAHFIVRGVSVSALNSGQFHRQQDLSLKMFQEIAQRRQAAHRLKSQPRGNRTERNYAVSRAELFGQRVPIAQPFGRVAQRQLCLLYHALGRQVRSAGSGCSPYRLKGVLAQRRKRAVKVSKLKIKTLHSRRAPLKIWMYFSCLVQAEQGWATRRNRTWLELILRWELAARTARELPAPATSWPAFLRAGASTSTPTMPISPSSGAATPF